LSEGCVPEFYIRWASSLLVDLYPPFFLNWSYSGLFPDLDKGQQIDAVLLDFSKAFDKVPHRRLLLKLHHSGVRSNTLSGIADFLSGCSQEVVLEGKYSAQCTSICWPLSRSAARSCTVRISWLSVERFFRNPCCKSERRLWCSRWVMMVEWRMCSRALT
jgi:hypothetical protein